MALQLISEPRARPKSFQFGHFLMNCYISLSFSRLPSDIDQESGIISAQLVIENKMPKDPVLRLLIIIIREGCRINSSSQGHT